MHFCTQIGGLEIPQYKNVSKCFESVFIFKKAVEHVVEFAEVNMNKYSDEPAGPMYSLCDRQFGSPVFANAQNIKDNSRAVTNQGYLVVHRNATLPRIWPRNIL